MIENSNNIVTRCVFGKTFGEVDGKGKSSELPKKVMVLLATFCWEDFSPFLGWIDILTGFKPSLKSTCGELDAFLDQVVEEHKTMKKDDEEHPNKKDFVDILLQLQKNGMLDFELSHDNLKAILLVSLSLSQTLYSYNFMFLKLIIYKVLHTMSFKILNDVSWDISSDL